MEWTEEVISRLQSLWQEGLSTAEIGRQLSITKNAVVGKAHRLGLPPRPSPIRKPGKEGVEATSGASAKAASSGKASAKKATPEVVVPAVTVVASVDAASPVPAVSEDMPRAQATVEPVKEPTPAAEATMALPVVSELEKVAVAPKPVSAVAAKPVSKPVAPTPTVTEKRVSEVSAEQAEEAKIIAQSLRPVLRSITGEPSTRRGPSCCWPLGDPGTPGFHFCGAKPLPGKPYCADHAALAYVKLRDRRDNVA